MNKSAATPTSHRRRADQALRDEAAAWIARRDAGLTDFEQEQFNQWCDAQPAHRAALRELDQVWTELDRPLQAGAADLLMEELKKRAKRRQRRRMTLASAAVAALLLAAVAGRNLWESPQPEMIVPSTKAVVLLPSVRSLPDGSVMELSDNAEVAVEFSPAIRRVSLKRGEAHFQVVKNKQRPFIVAAGRVEVRAVGTAFVVQRGTTDIEVVVTEGRVAVNAAAAEKNVPAAAGPAAPVNLAFVDAGSGVAVSLPARPNAMPAVRPLTESELGARVAWRQPRLEFSGTPLIEAAALMNRHSRVQLRIEDPAVGRLRVSGIFGAQNCDSFVRVLEMTFDLKAERRGENEIVLRRAED